MGCVPSLRSTGNLALYMMRERAETDYLNAMKYAEERAWARGEAKNRIETARRMLNMNFTSEQISQVSELSLDEVEAMRVGAGN